MKKIIIVMMCAMFLCGYSAKGKPKDLPQDVYDIAAELVPKVESYLKNGSDPSVLSAQIDAASNKIHVIYDSIDDVSGKVKTVSVSNDLTKMRIALTNISTSWLTNSDDNESKKELKAALKSLKKDIGM